jgi:Mycobacterium membrane protein
MTKVLRRAWLPIVIVIVVVIAGFTVHRVRTFFGMNPILVTPKNFGSYADINYLDLDSKPVRVDGATLPWSLTLKTTAPSVLPNIVAQGDGNSISCRITVDDVVKDEKTTTGVSAQTFCLVKNA